MGAPLLLSFDVSQLSKAQIDTTYGNPEIVAVNQDADEHGRGSRGGKRVSGSDFPENDNDASAVDTAAEKESHNETISEARATQARDGVDRQQQQQQQQQQQHQQQVHTAAAAAANCDASTFKYSRNGVQSSGLACHDAASAADCIAACCNAGDGCTTWQYNPKHSLKNDTTHCNRKHGGVWGPCWIGRETRSTPNAPDWIGRSTAASPPPPPPPPGSSLNVWARSLHDGSTAVLFINNAPDAGAPGQVMHCNAACSTAAGLLAGTTYAVRDLAARSDLAPITVDGTSGFASPSAVPADAGSLLLKFTPQ